MKITKILGILAPFVVTLSLSDEGVYQEPSIPSCPHEWTLGLIANTYQYRETYQGRFLMEDKGYMVGGVFEYVYRTRQSFIFGVDADFAGGYANYKSRGTGRMKNIGQNKFESRLKIGKRFFVDCGFTLTPYLGLGVRFKSDYSGGKRSTTGHHGYDRSSFYLYVPIGGKVKKELITQWAVEVFGEFDLFLLGKNKSHEIYWGESVTNTQKRGFGLRGGLEVIRHIGKKNSLSFGPFVNYWNIKDSDSARAGNRFWIEPHNKTVEAGLVVKYHF